MRRKNYRKGYYLLLLGFHFRFPPFCYNVGLYTFETRHPNGAWSTENAMDSVILCSLFFDFFLSLMPEEPQLFPRVDHRICTQTPYFYMTSVSTSFTVVIFNDILYFSGCFLMGVSGQPQCRMDRHLEHWIKTRGSQYDLFPVWPGGLLPFVVSKFFK
jgi:hypothetical protein